MTNSRCDIHRQIDPKSRLQGFSPKMTVVFLHKNHSPHVHQICEEGRDQQTDNNRRVVDISFTLHLIEEGVVEWNQVKQLYFIIPVYF